MKLKNTVLALCVSVGLFAQTPALVQDYNVGSEDSYNLFNTHSIAYEGNLIFTINSNEFGEEPAILKDGEIKIIKDINEGIESSDATDYFMYNDMVHFVATDAAGSALFWKTDGTLEGTSIAFDPNSNNIFNPFVSADGVLFYSTVDEIFSYDGTNATSIFKGTRFLNGFAYAGDSYCEYNGQLAFLYEGFNGVELYVVEEGEAKLKAEITDASGSVNFFGLNQVEAGLLFGVRDPFKEEVDGIYVYNETTNFLTRITEDGALLIPRRVESVGENEALLFDFERGYYVTDGRSAGLRKLSSRRSSPVQGDPLRVAYFRDRFVFATTGLSFGEDEPYLVYYDGVSESGIELLETNEYISNMIKAGKYAFMAYGTSNGFKPSLVQVDMETGNFEEIFTFSESSGSRSITLLNVVEDQLYFISSLDNAVGAELYAIDVTLEPSSIQHIATTDLDIDWFPEGFRVNYPTSAEVNYRIYTLAGQLLSTDVTRSNELTLWGHQDQMFIVEVTVEGKRTVKKHISF